MSKQDYYWIAFAACQFCGALLPLFGNVHSNTLPILLGALLLMPGDLLVETLGPRLPDLALILAEISVNFLFWWLGSKIIRSRAPAER
jgi:ABC-type Fe3+-siderophore transport system permease subunit